MPATESPTTWSTRPISLPSEPITTQPRSTMSQETGSSPPSAAATAGSDPGHAEAAEPLPRDRRRAHPGAIGPRGELVDEQGERPAIDEARARVRRLDPERDPGQGTDARSTAVAGDAL